MCVPMGALRSPPPGAPGPRLIIVALCRGHEFGDMDTVQTDRGPPHTLFCARGVLRDIT